MSGIYIPDMEMPLRDRYFLITPSGNVYDADEGLSPIPSFKAIPVHDHGDLIDKATVVDNLVKVLNKRNPPISYPDWNDAILSVMTAPTVIPASKEAGE